MVTMFRRIASVPPLRSAVGIPAFGILALGLVALGAWYPAIDTARAQAQMAPSAASLEPLSILTKSGRQGFSVEVMRTDAERERGLMFRRFLPDDRGMLFDFKTTQPVMMWMKNTYIPLDMIFISRDGRVASIARDAEPLSERIIPSGGPVFAVLEVNAGIASKRGIAVGDRVEHAMFAP